MWQYLVILVFGIVVFFVVGHWVNKPYMEVCQEDVDGTMVEIGWNPIIMSKPISIKVIDKRGAKRGILVEQVYAIGTHDNKKFWAKMNNQNWHLSQALNNATLVAHYRYLDEMGGTQREVKRIVSIKA